MSEPRIAILDDDATHLELLTTLLKEEGCEVVSQADLHAAFGFIRDQKPTLVLMDIIQHHQPIGLEVIRALKAHPETLALQLVVLSADASMLRQHAEQFVRDGIIALDKPYDVENLLVVVRDRVGVAGACSGRASSPQRLRASTSADRPLSIVSTTMPGRGAGNRFSFRKISRAGSRWPVGDWSVAVTTIAQYPTPELDE